MHNFQNANELIINYLLCKHATFFIYFAISVATLYEFKPCSANRRRRELCQL